MTTGPLAFDLTLQRRSKPVRTSQAAAKIKARNANADRGKEAEAAVAKALAAWQKMISQTREVNRLLDTRAAGRVVRSAAADFEFFSGVDIKTH
ncbi:MAG: hypothetical protein KDB90_18150, partial [Planctomycetes bacterium]|nr:hypothetical protein [Planctomycetota bacterium]